MSINNPLQAKLHSFTLARVRRSSLPVVASLVASAVVATCSLAAQTSATSPAPASNAKTTHHPSKHSAGKPIETPPPVQPPAAKIPDWPVNGRPMHAAVTWNSHGLHIDATNSSLQQILNDVSTVTGTKIEGMGSDQRVYGEYGPGQARDVISQLLQGSGYNVLLAGDLGSGTPRQILLSPRRASPGAPNAVENAPTPPDNIDEEPVDNEVDDQQQQLVPQMPDPSHTGFGPGTPVRTPQQVMEEMQQRQLQQQQQQQIQQPQQQQIQQQQQPPPNPPPANPPL